MAQAKCKVAIIFYSLQGHTLKLAQSIKKGLDECENISIFHVEGELLQVPELLSDEVLARIGAPQKPSLPVAKAADLVRYDAFVFGIPTRFGMACSQIKAFWDSTGKQWIGGELVGKMAAVFVSTGSQHGGQETTALTFVTQLAHHGIIFVPLGYTHPQLADNAVPRGGTPYGAGTLSGPDGSRQPTPDELEIAHHQGRSFARTVCQYYHEKLSNK